MQNGFNFAAMRASHAPALEPINKTGPSVNSCMTKFIPNTQSLMVWSINSPEELPLPKLSKE
jgi:hypothetical protein